RAQALLDLKFAAGDQWPANIQVARELEHRPCLTINKTDSFVRQAVNNMRQQRPRIAVHPVSGGADKKKAEIIAGLMRHIEVNSNAEVAYDTGADFQVRMGWGYWRVAARYVREDSFDQELYIDRVRNPFTVYMDPSSTAPDGSDAE
ncbi:portal protein, partial [Micrococcus luteus]